MQKCRPNALPFRHTHSASVPFFTDFFMDVRCLTFSLVECTPLLRVFSLPPFLPFSPLRSRPRLLSGISSRLTSLAVTLDFKELLHSSVTHQAERAIQRRAKREGGDEE